MDLRGTRDEDDKLESGPTRWERLRRSAARLWIGLRNRLSRAARRCSRWSIALRARLSWAVQRRPRWSINLRPADLPALLARLRYRLGESGWARPQWAARLRPAELKQLWPEVRTQTEQNIWYLYLDVFWAGIFMAAIAFNSPYALRLGATNTMMGWLSSLPSLLAIAVLVPAARFLETQVDRAPWLRRALFWGRVAFLGAALVPWLFPRHAAAALIAVLILRTIPMHFYSAGFSPMLADIIPVRDRARVMANRTIIMSATVAVFTSLFGRWMDIANRWAWASFPMNYQIVYVIGTIAGLLSTYFVGRIAMPVTQVVRRERGSRDAEGDTPRRLINLPDFRHLRGTAKGMAHQNRALVRIIINTFIFDLGAWLVGPLYMIFFINQLDASDGWVGLNTTMAHIGVIAGSFIWRRIIDRAGVERSLRLAVPMAAGYAFLVALFPNLTLILIWGVCINLINPGVSLSHVNMLYRLCPPERRASYMALYSTITSVGAFAAPMVGVTLSNVIDIRWILLVGGLIRLGGAGLFYLFRVEMPEAALAE